MDILLLIFQKEEVLFDRGIKYIINDIEEKNGIYYIDAEVLNNA